MMLPNRDMAPLLEAGDILPDDYCVIHEGRRVDSPQHR